MAGCGAAGSEVKSVLGRLVHEQDPQVAIAALLGHGTHTMTSHYIHHVAALIAAADSIDPGLIAAISLAKRDYVSAAAVAVCWPS